MAQKTKDTLYLLFTPINTDVNTQKQQGVKIPYHRRPLSQLDMIFWDNALKRFHTCPVNVPGFFFHFIVIFIKQEAA